MIIHISGAPGSGKSTFGIELKKIFKNIKILDLDDLFDNFINKNKFSIKAYQKYLDIIINKNKNIIFVGLNKDKGRSGALYDLKSDYNFYILYVILSTCITSNKLSICDGSKKKPKIQ